ncbi:CYTH domain-containing protein [Erythrobacter sp.]|uniref:CYTH domain-containing protein n=1 Tax=Erythrobacter sp. TaxID=1042 RepID=UPI001425E012|nr:CYTH domain-containing protein [Erythrobacter sp.]QIQ85621.1 MAG: CYTH domain-containing protein [Erythrobacter sp.]
MPPDQPPREIERKFLVVGDGWRDTASEAKRVRQAYLALTDRAQVRVRIVAGGKEAKLTIKSAGAEEDRAEFEYGVPVDEAEAMLALAATRVLAKTRHLVPAANGREWEIDVFEGALEGLVLAEIELGENGEDIVPPDWCGTEVTGDDRYYNAALAEAGEMPTSD